MKKKHTIRKMIIRIFTVLIVSVFMFGFGLTLKSMTKAEAFVVGEYQGSIYQNSNNDSYSTFVKNYQNATRPQKEIVIDATEGYNYLNNDNDDQAKVEYYLDRKGVLIPETGEISYRFNVEEEGLYNIKIAYYAVDGRSASVSKGIKVNGEYQFTEAKSFVLTRVWQDEYDINENHVDGKHDKKPSQIEKVEWREEVICNSEGYYDESYLFYFVQGENEITLIGDREPVVISTITLFQEKANISYQEALKQYEANKYQKCDAGQIIYKVQGESSFEKSSPSLTPVANYTSHKVEPYVNFLTRYNSIGGTNWRVAGDWISWEIEVPEDGLYQISVKYLQNFNRGKQSSRILYINDEIPFQECRNICFDYAGDWQNGTIGDENGAYWFFFKKGINTIKLQSTIGSYATTVREVNEVIANLNWVYRKVIMRTGVSPSKYQDFYLEKNIPGLYDYINESLEKLNKAIKTVEEISGERSDLISSLERTAAQLETFQESEKKIQVGLDELETNITSLGTWIMTISSQPLLIDTITIHGENTKLPKATTNIFQKAWHEFIMLIGSFTNDTSLKSSVSVDGPTITVWIMTGKDQSNLLRQLIDESFTTQNNVNVELKLVSATALLPATLAGNGPDVAIGVAQNIPVNWGLRNTVVDMSKFDDFEEVKTMFYDSAITPFEFGGATYALPDTQDFLIQYVRTDIFEEFELVDESGRVITPSNWDEVVDLLPVLQRQYLDYYLPNVKGALSPLLYSMIKQYGGELYLNDGAESGMMTSESSQAFYDFVNFYRNYGFAVDASFVNRFRTGEMPIGVSNFSTYNTLSVSAPEIRGNWEYALLPGKLNEDGSITNATTSTSTGTIILSKTKELDASWKFVKWWLGDTAQAGYARGMEAILGAAARYPTANKKAFASLPWSGKDYLILEKQRACAVGVPIVPGDYIVGRYIDNAFRQIINYDVNPNDSLYNYHQKINVELERKRKEFNLG